MCDEIVEWFVLDGSVFDLVLVEVDVNFVWDCVDDWYFWCDGDCFVDVVEVEDDVFGWCVVDVGVYVCVLFCFEVFECVGECVFIWWEVWEVVEVVCVGDGWLGIDDFVVG